MADKRVLYYVVGDKGLDAGSGVYLDSLKDIKKQLMAHKIDGNWILVLSIHGSENYVGDRVEAHRGGEGSYDAASITALFGGDAQFTKWRDQWGPSRLVLNSCAVGKTFEEAFIKAFTKPGSNQSAHGLGAGCEPHTDTKFLTTQDGKEIKTRAAFNKLSKPDQQWFKETLSDLNKKWGYFGSPPVPEDQLLNYYFDQPPLGGWPVVQVGQHGNGIGITFHDRSTKSEFHNSCSGGVGLRDRTSRVPRTPEDE